MDEQGKPTIEPVFLIIAALLIPAIVIPALVFLGDGLPARAVAVTVGAYAMAVVWAVIGVTSSRQEAGVYATANAAAERESSALIEDMPQLDVLDTIPGPGIAYTVAVAGSVGICPLGLKLYDRFDVDAGGRLSSPLCRTAAAALASLLKDDLDGEGCEPQVSCICPMPGRHLTFEVRGRDQIAIS